MLLYGCRIGGLCLASCQWVPWLRSRGDALVKAYLGTKCWAHRRRWVCFACWQRQLDQGRHCKRGEAHFWTSKLAKLQQVGVVNMMDTGGAMAMLSVTANSHRPY